jgi:hypothetical protein
MRHGFTLLLILTCFGVLFLVCYTPVLLLDHQFAYRDAGNYYYPLNKRVQTEWDHGRWPLWEPEENAGLPLLGNPTAAVFYPGKLVFAILPYAWGARVYIVAHAALAFLSMLVLMRSWGTSWFGSAQSAMAYTFGAPVLFQHSNVIYLIGAAWLPLGLYAADQWVRAGRRWGLVGLTVVLSMQILGGDPQAAYLLGVASIGYALGLAWSRARSMRIKSAGTKPALPRLWILLTLGLIALVIWCVVTLVLAKWLPTLRGPGKPPPPLRWTPWVPLGVNLAWGLAAVGFLVRWWRRGWHSPLGVMSLGLAGSATLAAVLTAAQVLPAIEFTQRTSHASARPDEAYQFTIVPWRLVELVWPNILGTPFESNDYWGDAIATPGVPPKAWVPSLYLGGLTLAMALSSLTIRHRPPWRVWLTVIAAMSLLGSLGSYTSPIWIARTLYITSSSATLRDWLPNLGPMDPFDFQTIRLDGNFRDSDGSLYWWLATSLPAFRQFRYPAKLFTFTALATAALAGLGWDRLSAGKARAPAIVLGGLFILTLATLALAAALHEPILAWLRSLNMSSSFGPFEAVAAYRAIFRSLGHALIVAGLGLILTILARKRPILACSTALILTTTDLAVANARFVLTVPQSVFELKPELAKAIEYAERIDPSPGPFRIHRLHDWHPLDWSVTPSKDRFVEVASWEHETLHSKYAIDYGLEYTNTIGAAELEDHEQFFTSFYARIQDNQVAQSLGVEAGEPVVYFSRRAYDIWNTRYFIVPFDVNGWRDPQRSSAPFLFETFQVYPNPARSSGTKGNRVPTSQADTADVRVLRNLKEFPRAWVVHDARPTIARFDAADRRQSKTMHELLYAADPIWNDPSRPVYDPHNLAWVGNDELAAIRDYLSGQAARPSEAVTVTYPDPQQAVLEVNLDSPGLVILADVYYPGWELAIDGKPAPIYRVNGSMRGAAVPSGPHRLVYTYSPSSFRIGRGVSIAGLAALTILGLACARWPVDPVLAETHA